MVNWDPRILGSMSLRPGMEYTGSTKGNNKSRSLPMVFSIDDTARLEITDSVLRVWVGDELVTRGTVTAAITNGTFTANLTGWTDNDDVGGTSAWLTGGYMALLGDGTNAAIRDQQVTVNEANTEHALRIVVARGPVTLRVGSTSGGDEYIEEMTMGTGTYSMAFTPTANFYIRLFSRTSHTVLVDSVAVEAAGTMELPVPWVESDLPMIRYTPKDQTMFLACRGKQQRVIQRHDGGSWSVSLYEPADGPFRLINATPTTITTSALNGDVTLTASKAIFKPGHVGALFRIESAGQTVTDSFSAQNDFSNYIRVTGIGGERAFSVLVSGTYSATLTVQRSVAEPGTWVDVFNYGSNTSYNDGLDNQVIYYRIGIKAGNYTSGTAEITLSYSSGSITGVAKVTDYTSSTVLSAVVLTDFGATTASSDWWEGQWSDYRGWPGGVALLEGRIWFGGVKKINGTISDAVDSFDDTYVGDAGPISREIGEGPIENINFLLPLGRLIIGTESNSSNINPVRMEARSILAARSSSLDEPLTPTNFNITYANTTGLYVDQSGTRLMSVDYDLSSGGFVTTDITMLVPEIAGTGFVNLAAQKNPDPRAHCPIADGTAALLVYDQLEEVKCWLKWETAGIIEDVCVLPRRGEDAVYYTIQRTINGATVRYHEKLAKVSECRGGTLNKQADSFYEYAGAATTTITGLGHLEGEEVVVWGAGKDLGTYTVTSAQITGLPEAVTSAIIGIGYSALYKSTKQGLSDALGMPMNQQKRIDQIGLVLANTHKGGLYFGPDFDHMDPLPEVENGETIDADYVWESYDGDMITFPGDWTTDSRFCLKAVAPRPCTILSVQVSITF